jgi:DNA modification methylase
MREGRTTDTTGKQASVLAGKEWTQYSTSIWSDIRKTREELGFKHPALFPVELPVRLLERFATDEDKVVLDPFAGSGSTIVAARQLGKQGIGIEISKAYAIMAVNRLAERELWPGRHADSVVYNANAIDLLKFVNPESIDVVITSPPYWNVRTRELTVDQMSAADEGDAMGDLGMMADYQDYLGALRNVFQRVYVALKRGKYCIVVVMDLRRRSKLYPLHLDVTRFMQAIGFAYCDLIVWDRRYEHNNLRPLEYPHVFNITTGRTNLSWFFKSPIRNLIKLRRLVIGLIDRVQPNLARPTAADAQGAHRFRQLSVLENTPVSFV